MAAITIGGRTLDPVIQGIAEAAAAAQAGQPPQPLSAAGMRAQSQGMGAMLAAPPPAGVAFENIAIEAPGRSIPARAYRPVDQDPAIPLLVYFHMGGGVIGDLDLCHGFCGLLAKETRAPVVSVDYRLAPEHLWPAGIDDAIFAFEWARDHADRFGAPRGKAGVGGDSMGGNFSAIVAQEMKRKGAAQPVVQLLIYPAVEAESTLPSMTTYGQAFPLTAEVMRWFIETYMPPGADRGDPKVSPLRTADLSGLAPALIYTAGFDPLSDEGEVYAKRLQEAGVETRFQCFDSLAHAFTAFTGAVPAAAEACALIARETAAALKRGA